jgi:RimJ/RimL family protein N-acetyltransferase
VDVVDVRAATVADAEGIARVHVASWQAAYGGLLPDDFLAGLRWQDRAETWRERLAADNTDDSTWVLRSNDRIIGFASIGPARDDDRAALTSWELYGIYLDSAAWQRGLGRGLAQRVLAEVPDRVADVSLWVLAGNARARRFYERLGFALDGTTKTDVIGGREVLELRYLLVRAAAAG